MVRLTDHPNMTLDVYRGRKTTMQQQQQLDKKPLRFKKISVPDNQCALVFTATEAISQ